MSDEPIYTEEQAAEIAGLAAAEQESKHNTHAFLYAVATTADTTKVGYLKEEEVGIPRFSMRTLKELSLYAKDVADDTSWADYFNKRAEILVSTSLSKDAKLIDLAVMSRTEHTQSLSPTEEPKENKGWFGKRKQKPQSV